MSDNIICRCEEIDENTIRSAVQGGCHTADAVKRRTRSGMGMCQSKTCYNLIVRIIREETGIELDKIKPFTQQAPVRPISADVFYNGDFNSLEELFDK
ncbi:MAG: (2Fe-2S)-binding protein [Oscillospiraceae bacterium]|nr:(2Fe-2S)-binding protein [Oscillospiraceae bacterium]